MISEGEANSTEEASLLKEYCQEKQLRDIIECLLYNGSQWEAVLWQYGMYLKIQDRQALQEYVKKILTLYTMTTRPKKNHVFSAYRVLEKETYRDLVSRGEMSTFWLVSKEKPSSCKEKEVIVEIILSPEIPYIPLETIGEPEKYIIAPFCRVKQEHISKGNLRTLEIEKPFIKSYSNEMQLEYQNTMLLRFNGVKDVLQKAGVEPLSASEMRMYTNWKRYLILYIRSKVKELLV